MTATITWKDRLEAGRTLIEYGLTLVPYSPPTWRYQRAGKAPIPAPEGGRIEISDPDHLRGWLRFVPTMNLAVMGLAQVDADNELAVDKAKELGVTSDDPVWIIRTGRGFRALYRPPGDEYKIVSRTKNGDPKAEPLVELDLLINVPAIVPPSIHPSGRPYEWIPGCSPADISFAELRKPPILVLEHWQNLCRDRPQNRSTKPPIVQSEGFRPSLEIWLAEHTRHGRLPNENGSGWINGISCPYIEHHARGDQSPSFGVNFQIGVWKCFTSSESGGLTRLAEDFGINVEIRQRRSPGRIRVSVPAKGKATT